MKDLEKDALQILKLIQERGYDAYLVGGYPRDKYLGRDTNDIDICTNMPNEYLEELFHVTKTEFLSSVIEFHNHTFEITRFRKDSNYEHHRFPKTVAYVSHLRDDLKRRDFIMNTLCIDADGNYVDMLGAKEDLDHKIIRAVGNPFEKLEEDALRILRAIRFACQLNFKIEKTLEEAILKNKHLVFVLSYRRIEQELTKIEESENHSYGYQLLNQYGIMEIIQEKRKKHIQ